MTASKISKVHDELQIGNLLYRFTMICVSSHSKELIQFTQCSMVHILCLTVTHF
jgi:hypothetical protein